MDNEFFSILNLFLKMKMVPEELLSTKIEISPIEYCAEAVVKLCNQKFLNGVFHLMNENIVTLEYIVEILNNLCYNIKSIPMEDFMKSYEALSENLIEKQITKICCVRNNKFLIEHNDNLSNAITHDVLGEDFKWPIISEAYLKCIFEKNLLIVLKC